MADAQSDQTKDDIDLSPEVEETGEDPFESLENDDTTWEDGETSEPEAEEESEDDEESDEEPVVEESEDFEEDSEDTTSPKQKEQETEPSVKESKEEDTPSKEESPSNEEQKRLNDEMAKRRIAEKQLRKERDQREQENLERYLEEAQDDEVELANRRIEVQRYELQKERSAVTQDKLEVAIQRAITEIDLFKTGSPEVQEELAKSLDDFERMYIVKDRNGNPTEVNADVYQFLQDKADSIRRLTGIGARRQAEQKANEKMRTVPRPSRTPKEQKVDPDLDAFDKEFGL